MFSGTPFTARTKLEGHAVRAMYACCGATDYYMETGDHAYWKTLNTLWERHDPPQKCTSPAESDRASEGEAFGNAYELPNDARLRRELRSHRQHDVELAHAGRQRRSEVHRRHRARAL